jgi:acetyl-CoA C-acetyltransferase
MGCVIQAGLGQAPARQAAIKAGLPHKVICTTINKVCASGMKSVAIAAQNILLGDADVIIAGGMESMSNVPFYNMQQRWGNKYGDITLLDGLAKDGLTDVYDHIAMGNFADRCAKDNHISRQDQDNFAIQSYKKSQAASEQGFFKQEIIPVVIPAKLPATIESKIATGQEPPFERCTAETTAPKVKLPSVVISGMLKIFIDRNIPQASPERASAKLIAVK